MFVKGADGYFAVQGRVQGRWGDPTLEQTWHLDVAFQGISESER